MARSLAVCEVADRCKWTPYVTVSLPGADQGTYPPVQTCRRHLSIIVDSYLGVSIRIHVEGL